MAGEKLVEGRVVGHCIFAVTVAYRIRRMASEKFTVPISLKERSDALIRFGMGNDPNVEGLLLRIIRVLVDKSNEVNVTSVIADTGTVFQVVVAPGDVGKVIGKNGRTAQALRILLSAMRVALKTRYGMDIVPNG
jgi:predicted RNA-binding protein YlqC (UPF0109 family)